MTLAATRGTMSHCDSIEAFLNLYVCVEAYFAHQAVQPRMIKQRLHLAEDGFYGVELRAVTHIQYELDVQLLVEWFDFFRFVNSQLVTKQCEGSDTHFLPQSFQVVYEIGTVHGTALNMDMRDPCFLGHRGNY